MKRTKSLVATLVALFFMVGLAVDADAQRPVTHPGKKRPCEDKIESSVDVTPWVLNGISIMTEQTTPIDTVDIVTGAKWVSSIVGGDWENYNLIVDSLKGSMANLSLIGHFQWTRKVRIQLREWKCIDGALVLVRDIDRTFDEETAWLQFGPFTGTKMSVKRIRTLQKKMAETLPADYEGTIE